MEHGDLNREEKSKCGASKNVICLLRLENDYILERLKILFKSTKKTQDYSLFMVLR